MVMAGAVIPLGAHEPDRLALRVTPAIGFAPANVSVRAMIQADPENRSIEIVADSDEFYRSSAIQLEGDKAPHTSTFEFRSLPPGEYEVRAVLTGTDGRPRATVRQTIIVMAGH
jgi:hypothetical protein